MPRGVPNVVRRKTIDASEQDLGSIGTATMASTGPAVMEQEIEPVSAARLAEKSQLDNLAFNEEKVTVVVSETTDKFAPRWVEIEVNGVKQLFWRGRETTCKRKFVEGLARAKPINYKNIEYVDVEGNKGVKWPATVGLAYPFQMVRDDNPKGPSWLKRLLAEPI